MLVLRVTRSDRKFHARVPPNFYALLYQPGNVSVDT